MKKTITVIIAAFIYSSLASCSGGITVNNEWKNKNKNINLASQRGLVLPVDMHVGGGNTEMSSALAEGFSRSSDNRWISLQSAIKLPPFNQNITHPVTLDPKNRTSRELLETLPAFIAGIKNQFNLDFNPRYVIAAHIDGEESVNILGKSMNIRAVLFDIEENTFVSSVNCKSKMPWTGNWTKDREDLLKKMASTGEKLLRKLTDI